MILACSNINKEFVTGPVLSNCSFHIEEKEKTAIVGVNGSGKTTLLRIIMNEISPDEGTVTISRGKSIGYLAQHQGLDSNKTIYEELLQVKQYLIDMESQIRLLEENMKNVHGDDLESMLKTYSRLNHQFELENGYAYQSEIIGVLKGLGFIEEDFKKYVNTLSGGQKTRVSLGKLLLSKPDIILLDEPTNHLDIASVSWLETFLSNYDGAVIIVSHDRYFLDKIVTKVIEIDHCKATTFLGNYTAYAEKKAFIRDAEMKAYLNQQKEIRHHEDVITKLKSFNREKSIRRAESREKMLDKIERLDRPIMDQSEMHIELTPQILSGNDVLSVSNLSKSFPPLTLFQNLNFEIKRGEKVAIIGDNGTGKTTILKMINQLIEPSNGAIVLGSKVHIGYYDQEHNILHSEKTLFEEISDEYPTLTNTQIRNVLAAFLFTNDDVFKLIRDLSGGERGRVSLAKLILSEANFLILDEPTNHLDIVSKEILESAINQYTGTVLYVSHDRYFINRTAGRILELTNKNLINYIGNYDYYMEKAEELKQVYGISQGDNQIKNIQDTAPAKEDWKLQKEEQARQRKYQNQIKKIEDEISKLETRSDELDSILCDPQYATDAEKLHEVHLENQSIQTKLETLMEQWETLSEEI